MSKQNEAFTLLEAVIVIVLIGILATVAIPRLQTDTTQEAADQILSDIRYTQHLALIDDVTNPNNSRWQAAFWSMRFTKCDGGTNWFYIIGSDKSYEGNIDVNTEAAIDPLSGKPMRGICGGNDGTKSSKIFITDKFGISNVTFTGSCNGAQHIGFDHLGRLHQGFAKTDQSATINDYASVLHTPCIITFTHPNGNFSINIQPETGYAYIVGQENQ